MCNFYLMYWVEGDQIMNDNYCVSPGPPSWYWSDVRALHTENIPSDASIVPGTDKVFTTLLLLLGLFPSSGVVAMVMNIIRPLFSVQWVILL